MTRFARAKGSKSSNERKPEEATSWSEMRSLMLSKKLKKQEEKPAVEEPVKVVAPNKTEWASLGDDTLSESISLLKQHSGKKNSNSKEIKKEKKKKKVGNEKKLNAVVSPSVNGESKVEKIKKEKMKKKIKKENISTPEAGADSEIKVNKKGKKRKLTEVDVKVESVLPKKKKKLMKSENADSSVKEGGQQKEEKFSNKNSQKHQNMKKGGKSKPFKNGNEFKRGFKFQKGKQFEGGKKFKNKNFKQRSSEVEELIINGEKVPITKFQGFYVTLEDAERLKKLRSEMIKEGIPKAKLEAALKLERRRAEKALSRLKKSVCFHCRAHGHLLSNCPNLLEKENTGTGICYKCGSTEHSAAECKVVRGTNYQFAECFICKEQGHIARQCPDNPRGLYPQGGACRECGDVTHLRKDCPKVQAQKAEDVVTVGVRRDRDLECLDEEIATREEQNSKKKVKKSSTVKF